MSMLIYALAGAVLMAVWFLIVGAFSALCPATRKRQRKSRTRCVKCTRTNEKDRDSLCINL